MNLREYNLPGQAESFLIKGKFETALLHFQLCIELAPNNPGFKNSAGYCLTKLGQYHKALAYFEGAVKGEGNNPAYLDNLGSCLAHLRRDQEALPFLQRAAKADPHNPLHRARLSACEAELGIESAASHLRIAYEQVCGNKTTDTSGVLALIRNVAKAHDIMVPGLGL